VTEQSAYPVPRVVPQHGIPIFGVAVAIADERRKRKQGFASSRRDKGRKKKEKEERAELVPRQPLVMKTPSGVGSLKWKEGTGLECPPQMTGRRGPGKGKRGSAMAMAGGDRGRWFCQQQLFGDVSTGRSSIREKQIKKRKTETVVEECPEGEN